MKIRFPGHTRDLSGKRIWDFTFSEFVSELFYCLRTFQKY